MKGAKAASLWKTLLEDVDQVSFAFLGVVLQLSLLFFVPVFRRPLQVSCADGFVCFSREGLYDVSSFGLYRGPSFFHFSGGGFP